MSESVFNEIHSVLNDADIILRGTVIRILEGKITMEFVIRICDGTSLGAIITRETGRRLGIRENDTVWAVFYSFAVILHADQP